MRTVPLEEALSLSSKGPLKQIGGYIHASDGKTVADIRYMSGREIGEMDTAVLAHCFNHFPEVVEALKDAVDCIAEWEAEHAQGAGFAHRRGKEIIAKATNVNLPD